jgi:WD40 repeat protein
MDTTVRVWDGLTRRVSKVLNGDGSQIFQLVYSHDGRWLASGNGGGTTRLWNLTTDRSELFKGFDPDFSEDGVTLVTSRDGVARLWDTATGEGRALPDAYSNVAISPDGKVMAVIGKDGAVHLWDDDLPRDPAALKAWLNRATDHTVRAGHAASRPDPDQP